jgi:hypothetical protein
MNDNNVVFVDFKTGSVLTGLLCTDCDRRLATHGAWCRGCLTHVERARTLAAKSLALSAEVERPRRHVQETHFAPGDALARVMRGECPGCGRPERVCTCGEE